MVCVRLNAANGSFSALLEFKRQSALLECGVRVAVGVRGAPSRNWSWNYGLECKGTGNCGRPKGKSNQVESIIFVVVPVYCLYVLFSLTP